MSNARSRYDIIAGYLEHTHEVGSGLLYGKPCLLLNGVPFAAFAQDAMAFRLHGRSLAQALALPGARGWDPLRADRAAPGWVWVPVAQSLRWDRLALDALRCAREAAERRVSYAVPTSPPPVAAPPPSAPASLAQRAAAALAAGLRTLTLARPS